MTRKALVRRDSKLHAHSSPDDRPDSQPLARETSARSSVASSLSLLGMTAGREDETTRNTHLIIHLGSKSRGKRGETERECMPEYPLIQAAGGAGRPVRRGSSFFQGNCCTGKKKGGTHFLDGRKKGRKRVLKVLSLSVSLYFPESQESPMSLIRTGGQEKQLGAHPALHPDCQQGMGAKVEHFSTPRPSVRPSDSAQKGFQKDPSSFFRASCVL